MPHIIAIGSHPDEFFTHLAAAKYTYTQHETYSVALLSSEKSPVVQAVAVNGPGVSIDSVLEILKANIVLLLFSASIDYLTSLKNATGTTLDLGKIKLEDGVPLIVYRLHALDRFHFVLPCSLYAVVGGDPSSAEKHEASEPTCTYSENLKYSVGLIEQCLSHSSQYLTSSQVIGGRDGVTGDSLSPPTGTSFVSSASLTVVIQGGFREYTHYYVIYKASLELELHTYATNHTPIPNASFSSNGGVVYTVIRYKRALEFEAEIFFFPNPPPRLMEVVSQAQVSSAFYKVKDSTSLLRNYLQTPKVPTGKEGDTYYYNIDLNKSLNLFRNNGATPFQHILSYSESYTRDGVEQTAHTASNSEVEFRLTGSVQIPVPLYGICMFESGVGHAELVFEAETDILGSAKVPLDLTFGGA